MKKIIALYGGPGSGKTTTMHGLMYKLKLAGFNAEVNPEYVKKWVWEGRKIKEGDQTYFFSKMSKVERDLIEKELDFIITDSPLVLTHYYGLKYDVTEQKNNTSLMMLKHHHEYCKERGYKVDHFFIKRTKTYNPNGRYQNEDQARLIDTELRPFLTGLGINYTEIDGDVNAVDNIVKNYINVPFHSFGEK